MASQTKTVLSEEDYLARERRAETKSEYFGGEVVCLAGASADHNLIVTNLVRELSTRLKGRPCRVYSSDMRVKVPGAATYAYPDVVVVCGPNKFDDQQRDTLLNPVVVIEVLSESTEHIDRGTKFGSYRQMQSLHEYVLVSQNALLIEAYTRTDNNRWLLTEFRGIDSTLTLESIQCAIPLIEIYDKVEP